MKVVSKRKIIENINQCDVKDYFVIKSNAYGFGTKEIISLFQETVYQKFAVLELETAALIRVMIPKARILLLGRMNEQEAYLYQQLRLEVSVNSISEINFCIEQGILFQIPINSGMNRFGFTYEEITHHLNFFHQIKNNILGIYSHNATLDQQHMKEQMKAFQQCLDLLSVSEIEIHFGASSFTRELFPFFSRRLGAMIYRDSFQILGKVLKKNKVLTGSYIGYDYQYQMKEDGWIAVVDLGYSDGLVRNCEGYEVWIQGKYYSMVGKTCMNQCFVLIEEAVLEDAIVEVIGPHCPLERYLSFTKMCEHEAYIAFGLSKCVYI